MLFEDVSESLKHLSNLEGLLDTDMKLKEINQIQSIMFFT